MLDPQTYKEILSIRAMAKMLYDNADRVLKKEDRGAVSTARLNKGGLTEEQKATLIAKRKARLARQMEKSNPN